MFKNEQKNNSNFNSLGISLAILSALKRMGIENATPIQEKSIPIAISGRDLFGVAQTGTGKTFAFGIPTIERIKKSRSKALIILPTRELANQVEESLKKIAQVFSLKTISIIGGEAFNRQLFSLKRNPDIIVATPGRLLDHVKRKTINLNNISILVLDEADMMFDMGFAPQVEEIINLTPKNRQTLLFSATMPAAIIKLAEKYLKSPLQIQVAPSGTTAELIDQEIYLVRSDDKFSTLEKILNQYKNLVLIFVRTRMGATKLAGKLREKSYGVSEIHSNLSFNQRKKSLTDFKSAFKRILVATDVAARGLDINDIQLVVNYDLPDNSEDYVHRIGRTARAGKGGKAISFSLPHQRRDIQKIERLIKKNLPINNSSSGTNKFKESASRVDNIKVFRGAKTENKKKFSQNKKYSSNFKSGNFKKNKNKSSFPKKKF